MHAYIILWNIKKSSCAFVGDMGPEVCKMEAGKKSFPLDTWPCGLIPPPQRGESKRSGSGQRAAGCPVAPLGPLGQAAPRPALGCRVVAEWAERELLRRLK